MKKTTLRILIVNAGLALLALGFLLICRSLAGTLESQKAALRWAGDSDLNFAQLSVFMSGDDSLGLSDVYTFRQALSNKLTESSLEAPENGSLFTDAWSSAGRLNVSGDHGSGEAEVTAVGGNYFLFHPLRLLSGSYLTEDDVMDDRVILDRELAWRLFGGFDLAGMTVTIGETPFVVAGVVEREQDFASRKAHDGGMGMYMSYRAYSNLASGGTAEASAGTAPIDCYELVMPQPVAGFAEDIVKNNFKLGGGELVNNTGRFSAGSIYTIIREFGSRSMHLNSVIYPYWENAARCLGDWCALFLALAILFAVSPAVTALITGMILLIHGKDALSKKVPALFSEAVDRSRRRRSAKRRV